MFFYVLDCINPNWSKFENMEDAVEGQRVRKKNLHNKTIRLLDPTCLSNLTL